MGSFLNQRRLAAVVALGILACLGIPAAQGAFILWYTAIPLAGSTDYVLSALNDGSGGTGTASGGLVGNEGAVQQFTITVPEPTSAALVLLGSAGFLRRRRA